MAASSAFSGLGYRSAAGAHGGQMLLWKLSCHLLLCWFVQKWRTLFRNDPKWQCLVSIFFHIFPTGKMRIHHGIRRLFVPQTHWLFTILGLGWTSWADLHPGFEGWQPTYWPLKKTKRHHPTKYFSSFSGQFQARLWLLSDWDFLDCRLTHQMCCQRTIVGVEGM